MRVHPEFADELKKPWQVAQEANLKINRVTWCLVKLWASDEVVDYI